MLDTSIYVRDEIFNYIVYLDMCSPKIIEI